MCAILVPLLFLLPPGSVALPGDAENRESPDEVLRDQDVTLFYYHIFDMTILSLPGSFDFLYSPEDTLSVANAARRNNYRFVVNGSYFHPDRTHAGFLSIDGRLYSEAMSDIQLTHVVTCDRNDGSIEFLPAGHFTPQPREGLVEFQTGPLVIGNDSLCSAAITRSINGQGSYRRTLLAAIDMKHLYLIVVRSPVSLGKLGEFLLRTTVFSGGRLDVVNLDGGSSVALWSRNFSSINFNANARLPILLGVR